MKTSQSLQQVAGQLRINQGVRTLPHTLHKNKLRMAETYKTRHQGEHRQTLSDINHSTVFLGPPPKTTEIKLKLTSFCTAKKKVKVKVGKRNGNPLQYSCLDNPMD